MNYVDQIIQFVIKNVGWDSLGDAGFRDEETLKQYIAFQILHDNIMFTVGEDMEVTGVMVAYDCDENEAYGRFNWEPTKGKTCIFVAQLASTDADSTKLLAHGFLERFKENKTTVAVRRGSYTTMKAHDIANRMLNTKEALN